MTIVCSSLFLKPTTAVVLALSLSACANFSGIAPVATVRDAASLGLTSDSTDAAAAAAVDAQWWRAFGDEQLNSLISQAIAGNPSLRIAQARLARAQAGLEITGAATGPQLAGAIDLTHQLFTKNGMVPPPLAGAIYDTGTIGLSASWELDFFNKNRSALDAALGLVNAAQADTEAARVLLASNVARSYIQLARLNEQLGLAQRTLAQRAEVLELVRGRVAAGLDTRLELRQSEGGLPEARLQIEMLQEQATLTRNALAALVGQPALAPPSLQALKPMSIGSSIPADLLGRRADIAAARWRVQAASSDASSAKAQFYPNINLVAFAGFSSIGLDRLLDAGSQQWGVGPALRLPIFDGGRLRANLRGKTAEIDMAVESYNAAVIDALRDVADQLASSRAITRQQAEQRAAQTAAESAYEIAVKRYQAGLGNYLFVLSAETSVLGQRRAAADLGAHALETQVALMRALGGGYDAIKTGAGDARFTGATALISQ
jgi:NodT family efflux transporter outer membrane factor (OMF) lipoprotein